MNQLNLFEQVTEPESTKIVGFQLDRFVTITEELPFDEKTGRYILPYTFALRAEPYGLPDFNERMLIRYRDEGVVFKDCPDCGAVYAFTCDSSYHSCQITCFRCERKLLARQMGWGIHPIYVQTKTT